MTIASLLLHIKILGRVLGGFQDQVERRLTGRLLIQMLDGRGEYTSAEALRYEVGFEPTETDKYRVVLQLIGDSCSSQHLYK